MHKKKLNQHNLRTGVVELFLGKYLSRFKDFNFISKREFYRKLSLAFPLSKEESKLFLKFLEANGFVEVKKGRIYFLKKFGELNE